MKKLLLILVMTLAMATFAYGQIVRGTSTTNSGDVIISLDGEDIAVEGGVAEDAASTEPPVPIGGIAESTVPTAVADGDAIGEWYDTYGKSVIYGANLATGAIDVNLVNAPPVESGCTHLIDTTLNSTGGTTNATMFIGDADKLAIYVFNDEEPGADDSEWNGVLELSPDGTALMTATINVINSEDNAVATADDWKFDTDEERYFWFPAQAGITAQYLKLTATCDADCSVTEYHAIDVWVCTNE